MVNITLTPEAANQIKKKLAGRDLDLKLMYDIDGCSLSGIPTLRLMDKQERGSDEISVQTNEMPVWVEKSKLIFFDDHLEIDFSEQSHTYQLASAAEILNGRMSLLD
ncbi:iron-sulfur cluster biosynthesis family protein [Siminovitchia fortis]|uniref:iron-sulfur cluster biosynthesis family protein n=1 Tax=Siminovitchia fortis TaxID=254758 RepID=UPI0024C1A066|nr:iron-sulfur cluster biosynthesis family protein [Siminovitchia fortis]WHY82814.1 iron-sulfur cluster biosynthesis family protein [Siminovitchia fortis]